MSKVGIWKELKNIVLCISLAPLLLFSSIDWFTKTPMPTLRSYICAGVVDNKIYVFGGANSSGVLNTVEMYDPTSDTWTTKTPMPTARRMPACGVVDNKIYVIGGEASGTAYGTVEVYDPLTDSWETKASMPTPRSGHAIGVVKEKIYAIGGNCIDWTAITTVEEYDPTTDSWQTKTDMPTARFWLTVAVTNDSLLYAIGGGEDDFYGFSTVEIYDPLTDTWQSKTPVSTPRFGPVSIIIDDTIYAIGGFDLNTAYVPLDVVERYEESTNTWFNDTPVPTGRYLGAGAEVTGKMYVIGGFTSYATGYSGVNEEGIVLIGINENESQIAHSTFQLQIHPNPFRQVTEIRIQMQARPASRSEAGDVRCNPSTSLGTGKQDISLKIYDVSGRIVKVFNLTSDLLLPASVISWDGTNDSGQRLPAGVYIIRVYSRDFEKIEKVILLK